MECSVVLAADNRLFFRYFARPW